MYALLEVIQLITDYLTRKRNDRLAIRAFAFFVGVFTPTNAIVPTTIRIVRTNEFWEAQVLNLLDGWIRHKSAKTRVGAIVSIPVLRGLTFMFADIPTR